MKRIKNLLAAFCLAAAIAIPTVALTTGCRTPTQQKFAVNTITTSHLAVDAALDTYLDLVVAGKLATNSVPTVLQSYAAYQGAYRASLMIVLNNSNAPAPPALQTAAAAFTATVSTATKGGL